MSLYFRQLIDDETASLSYLLGDPVQRRAVAIDPSAANLDLILAILADRDLHLEFVLRTRVTAEEAYGCGELRGRTGAKLVAGRQAYCPAADLRAGHDDVLVFGNEFIRVLATPGHTAGGLSALWRDRLFCGDVLDLDDDAPADPADFEPGALFDSVSQHLLTLPEETLVFPAHQRRGRMVTTVGAERRFNPWFAGRSREAFLTEMAARGANRPQLGRAA